MLHLVGRWCVNSDSAVVCWHGCGLMVTLHLELCELLYEMVFLFKWTDRWIGQVALFCPSVRYICGGQGVPGMREVIVWWR